MPKYKHETVYYDLDVWIAQIVLRPADQLNAKFSDWKAISSDGAIRSSIVEAYGDPQYTPFIAFASEGSLRLLHGYFHGLEYEYDLWEVVIGALNHPLPPDIAHDLLDRDIATIGLIHSIQEPTVQWRMATEYGNESILGLGIDAYWNPQRSLENFRRVLETFGQDYWLLNTLLGYTPSSGDKEALFLEVVQSHERADELLRIRIEIIAGKIETARVQQEAYMLTQQAHTTTDPEELRALRATGYPEVLLEVAKHPATPIDVLLELVQLEHQREAKQIRHLARENLHTRGQKLSNRLKK